LKRLFSIPGLIAQTNGSKAASYGGYYGSSDAALDPRKWASAGYEGARKMNGSKIHPAVDTRGPLLALLVTAADEQDRDLVDEFNEVVQEVTGDQVQLAYVDQGYTGAAANVCRNC
jgi:hypothetical protein